jgi:undecaprenyl-diphosphatase
MGSDAMDWWQAILLGLVEGVTEYLPVSSTGHLLITQRLLGLEGRAANTYAICIQAGAILAVLGLYRERERAMLAGLVGRDAAGRRLAEAIAIAFVPAAVLGLAFDEAIEERLFGPWPIVAAWLAGGVAILVVERVRRQRARRLAPEAPSPRSVAGLALADLDARRALMIGLAQCLALWPGTSRSLATIAGGVLVGLGLKAAVEFSFLLGVVTLLAATLYKGLSHGDEMLASYSVSSMLLGFATAWVAAVVSVRWMVSYLERHGLSLFGWYRVGLALVVAAWLWRAGTAA